MQGTHPQSWGGLVHVVYIVVVSGVTVSWQSECLVPNKISILQQFLSRIVEGNHFLFLPRMLCEKVQYMFGNPINLEGLAATCTRVHLKHSCAWPWECGTKLVQTLNSV